MAVRCCVIGARAQRYEGLTKEGLCHVRGVMTYGDTGETYAGEFAENSMNGLGEYRWSDGSLYQGQWKDNNKHVPFPAVLKTAQSPWSTFRGGRPAMGP